MNVNMKIYTSERILYGNWEKRVYEQQVHDKTGGFEGWKYQYCTTRCCFGFFLLKRGSLGFIFFLFFFFFNEEGQFSVLIFLFFFGFKIRVFRSRQ